MRRTMMLLAFVATLLLSYHAVAQEPAPVAPATMAVPAPEVGPPGPAPAVAPAPAPAEPPAAPAVVPGEMAAPAAPGTAAPIPEAAAPAAGSAAVAPADLPPQTPEDWSREYRRLRASYHSGMLALAAAVILLLVRLSRTPLFGRLLDRLPRDWRWTVPVGLGILAIFLPELAAGVAWWRALLDGLIPAFAAIGTHSAIVRDMLGVPSPREAALAAQALAEVAAKARRG